MKIFNLRSTRSFYVTAIVISLVINIHSAYSINSEPPRGFMDRDRSVKELQKMVDGAFPSIVMVIVYDISGNESARGCGFFYDAEGRIITNASILKNAYSAKVISQTRAYDNVSILRYDETIDAAMIKVNARDVVPLVMDFNGDISINEKVIALGMSADFKKTLSEGIVTSVKSIDTAILLIHGSTVAPLFSYPPSESGPLLNADGKVIGLTTYALSGNPVFQNKAISFSGESINAISARSLLILIDQNSSPTKLQPSKSKIWWHWFKYRIKSVSQSVFLTLYELGLTTILQYIVMLLIFILILQWIYRRSKERLKNFKT